jgi:hypothetical protein
MKSLILFSVFLLFMAGSTTAQKVVAATGGTATVNGYEISWTIGEPITQTVTDGTTTLTQGFQQSKLTVTAIDELRETGVEVKVYPNPTQDFVTIHLSKIMEKSSYLLFDLSGKLLEQKNIESTDAKIDMTGFAEGAYILKLNYRSSQPLQTFKIVKR